MFKVTISLISQKGHHVQDVTYPARNYAEAKVLEQKLAGVAAQLKLTTITYLEEETKEPGELS